MKIFLAKTAPEVFLSTAATAQQVRRAVKRGEAHKLGQGLYTSNTSDSLEDVARRNWQAILKLYYPDAQLADRTALEQEPAWDGSVCIISSRKRDIMIPGDGRPVIKFRPRKGPEPLPGDPVFADGLRISSSARACLENMRDSNSTFKNPVRRTLDPDEMRNWLYKLARDEGLDALERLRQEAEFIAHELDMAEEYKKLSGMIRSAIRNAELSIRLSKTVCVRKRNPIPHSKLPAIAARKNADQVNVRRRIPLS